MRCIILHAVSCIYSPELIVLINSSDAEINNEFHILLETFTPSPNPPFCQFEVLATTPFNYEARTSYGFMVAVTDSQNKTSVAMVSINVLPVNEYGPVFTVPM